METAIISASAAIIVTTIGAALAYFYNQRLARRQAQLVRVNEQLSDLYGPMYATLESTEIAYRTFLKLHRNGAELFYDPGAPPPSAELVATWRLWMTEVMQPGNRLVFELIKSKTHLLVDSEIPQVLLDFCAHVTSWEVRIREWELGHNDSHWSGVSHPGPRVKQYARTSLAALKREQLRLLNLTRMQP